MAYKNPEDQKAAWNRWYEKNRLKKVGWTTARKAKIKAWLTAFKTSQKCASCPENHIACLVFHHLDPTLKEISLGDVIRRGWGLKKILREVEKCIILCGNCHAKLHWNEQHGA